MNRLLRVVYSFLDWFCFIRRNVNLAACHYLISKNYEKIENSSLFICINNMPDFVHRQSHKTQFPFMQVSCCPLFECTGGFQTDIWYNSTGTVQCIYHSTCLCLLNKSHS